MCHIKFDSENFETKCLPPAAFAYHPIGKKIIGLPLKIVNRSPLDESEGKLNGFYYKVEVASSPTNDPDSKIKDFLEQEGFGPLHEKFEIGQEVILLDQKLQIFYRKLEETDPYNATGKPI